MHGKAMQIVFVSDGYTSVRWCHSDGDAEWQHHLGVTLGVVSLDGSVPWAVPLGVVLLDSSAMWMVPLGGNAGGGHTGW